MEKKLSDRDIKKRELILNGNMWKVVINIAGPLAFYQWMQQFFKVFDTVIASHISPMSVSALAYLNQFTNLITSIGSGIAIGSCIKISEAYGAGEFEIVHKRVNNLFKICGIMAVIIGVCMPFSVPLLKALDTPDDFITEGSVYFIILLFDCILNVFATAYIAIERVRGNSTRILKFNFMAFSIKLLLSSLFVFVFNQGVEMIAIATVISDLLIFSAFIYHLCLKNKGDIFSISSYDLRVDKEVLRPLMSVSGPVVAEKASFQLGKVWVTTMTAKFGSFVSGALGVSNNIGGILTTLQMGFQDAGSSIISQNVGAGNKKRSLEAFYVIFTINMIIGTVGYILAITNLTFIVGIFDGGDAEFARLITQVYTWEAYGTIPLSIFAAATALLYGYGYTKITLVINFARLFILRVPVLWYFQNFTDLGSESVGIAMGVSNAGTGIIGGIVIIFVVNKIKKEIAKEEQILEEQSK